MVAGARWLFGSVLAVLAERFVARRSSSGHQVSDAGTPGIIRHLLADCGIIDDAMALEDNEKLHMMPDATVGWTGHIVLLEQHPAM